MSNRGRHKKSNKHLIIQILGKTTANRIMECQKEQGNIPNLDIFLHILISCYKNILFRPLPKDVQEYNL
mgnify:CR=1 FL=1